MEEIRSYFTRLQHCPHVSATSVINIENVLQCITAYVVIAWLGSSKSCQNAIQHALSQCMFYIVVTGCDYMDLPMGIYPSLCSRILRDRILRVRGYMEMCSTCNLVDVQTMHGIYIKW